ncbi:MAG: hypothetical protein J5I50_05480 [Chitinophagaceae bacterium]|nr:hypothetical protein [Chitinophagaceae bacterium]
MDRVKTLIEKLLHQAESKVSPEIMLATVQMLQVELSAAKSSVQVNSGRRVAVMMPSSVDAPFAPSEDKAEEKIVEVLQVDEKEIEEELAQMKKKAETIQSLGYHNNPALQLNLFDEVPTLSHQDPLPEDEKHPSENIDYNSLAEYEENLNDKLKSVKKELSETLTSTPIKDLKKAIEVNERYLFINELFRGDESVYERSIKTIQSFSNYAEAEFWIRRELKVKIGWQDNNPIVKQFDNLVRRRFS